MGAADPLEAVAGREAARGPHEPGHGEGASRIPRAHAEAATQGCQVRDFEAAVQSLDFFQFDSFWNFVPDFWSFSPFFYPIELTGSSSLHCG